MASLQQILGQSVQQSMGLGDILAQRQREAEQLGQATLQGNLRDDQRAQQRQVMSNQQIQQGLQGLVQMEQQKKQEEALARQESMQQDVFESGLVEKGLIPRAEIEVGGQPTEVRSLLNKEEMTAPEYLQMLNKGFEQTTADDIAAVPVMVNGQQRYVRRAPEKGKFKYEEGLGIFNEATGEIKTSVEELGLPTGDPEKQFQQERQLRNDFEKSQGDFVKVRDAWGRIKASAKDASAAGDLALIFNYMKVLDPGSTVREGEFANAQNAAGVPERVVASYNNAVRGERLTTNQRRDFVDRAKKLYKAQKAQNTQTAQAYRKLAKQYNLDPSRVVLPQGSATPDINTTPPSSRSNEALLEGL